jgi:hypothetical protein
MTFIAALNFRSALVRHDLVRRGVACCGEGCSQRTDFGQCGANSAKWQGMVGRAEAGSAEARRGNLWTVLSGKPSGLPV